MFKLAMSTVACPDWTLQRVAERACALGFAAVELRTFGLGPTKLASDPAHTDPAKVRTLFESRGVAIAGVAASTSFAASPKGPPVIGRALSNGEQSVRSAKHHIATARSVGASYVRVFGFDLPAMERREVAMRRLVDRLKLVVDDARHTGVCIALENGGSFCGASQVMEIIERVDSPLLGVCYSMTTGVAAGDDVEAALERIGGRLISARIKDLAKGRPCPLGDGDQPCRAFVEALRRQSFEGALVYEWGRLWDRHLAPAEEVLPTALERLLSWTGAPAPAPSRELATV